jgi:uncharacterized protein YbjT (DUF2867 family)
MSSLIPPPSVLFSALATTRAAAGGFDKQYKLEHDLNVELAEAAKKAGTKVYVLISSSGASSASRIGYSKMKGEIEDHIKELGFDQMVILRPGLIAGNRGESRMLEGVARKLAAGLGMISASLKDPWAQEAEVIGKAAVSAGLKALNGEAPAKVWILSGADIVRLGRTESKEI